MKTEAVQAVRPLPVHRDWRRCFTITCEGRVYGLPVECIQTVFEIQSVTPVPLAPMEVLGLVNLRGKIVTTISLRRRLRSAALPEPSKLAVGIDHNGESFAVVVDEVGDVLTLDAETQIEAPAHLGSEHNKIAAVHRLPDLILPILDLGWLFSLGTRAPVPHPDGANRIEGRLQ